MYKLLQLERMIVKDFLVAGSTEHQENQNLENVREVVNNEVYYDIMSEWNDNSEDDDDDENDSNTDDEVLINTFVDKESIMLYNALPSKE